MAILPKINANIIITNNVIDKGISNDNITPLITYKYDNCATIYGSAVIDGNTFSNPNANANMLQLKECSCIIKNNKFIRNSTSISKYIRHLPNADDEFHGTHIITDNIFDERTTDGSSESLVAGLNPGTIYTRNKNQTGFIYVPLNDSDRFGFGFGGPLDQFNNFGTNVYNYTQRKYNLIAQFDTASSSPSQPNTLIFLRTIQLAEYLERGMKLEQIGFGIFSSVGTIDPALLGSHSITAQIDAFNGSVSMDAQHHFSVPGSSQANMNAQYIIDTTDKITDLGATTQYAYGGAGAAAANGDYFGFNSPDYFRYGNGYHLELKVAIAVFYTNTWTFRMSPIEIKYIW